MILANSSNHLLKNRKDPTSRSQSRNSAPIPIPLKKGLSLDNDKIKEPVGKEDDGPDGASDPIKPTAITLARPPRWFMLQLSSLKLTRITLNFHNLFSSLSHKNPSQNWHGGGSGLNCWLWIPRSIAWLQTKDVTVRVGESDSEITVILCFKNGSWVTD